MKSDFAAMVTAALLPLIGVSGQAPAAPVISEFFADPLSAQSLADEGGEASDWIEIANDGGADSQDTHQLLRVDVDRLRARHQRARRRQLHGGWWAALRAWAVARVPAVWPAVP